MFLCKKFILIVLKLDFYDLLFEIYNVISIGVYCVYFYKLECCFFRYCFYYSNVFWGFLVCSCCYSCSGLCFCNCIFFLLLFY